jgi:predicted PurR-regulated permease PerM
MIANQPPPTSTSDRLQASQKLQSERFSRYFLLTILIGITFIFFNMVKIFLVPVLLGTIFTVLFYPFYKRILRLFNNRRGLSAFVCCVLLILGLLVPIYFVADIVSQEAVGFYQTAQHKVREIIQKGDEGLLGKIKTSPWVQRFNIDKINWQSALQNVAGTAGSIIATIINKTSTGTLQILAYTFITLFTMFYFFMDGEALVRRIKYLIPLSEEYEDALISRFVSVSRATIKGTLLIGLMKGSVGALTLWIVGVDSAFLWGVIMIILSVIPMIGAWLVMYPAAAIQLITGHIWQGIVIIAVTVVIISNIDNVLQPRLVGQETGMHDLMIFFSTLGGLSMFGPIGFIVGPVIAALFLTILDIYSLEFKSHLDLAGSNALNNSTTRQATPHD